MEARSLEFFSISCSGELTGEPQLEVLRVSTDSRTIRKGDLFVALTGDKFDGHQFLDEVFTKGAVAAVVEKERLPKVASGRSYISVSNTREALGKMASAYRGEFDLKPVAVAGSNGKTTTKELLASVLRQKLETVWSEASFNNDIGVPLTLLNIENRHQAGVFEVGTNHPGELRPLLQMIRPEIGVITSVGREHLEFFGDVDGVAAEEGTLAEVLPSSGLLVINGDEPHAEGLKKRCPGATVRIGRGSANDWRITAAEIGPDGTRFQVEAPEREYSGEYRIQLLGMHQVVNATYCIVVGRNLGLGRAEIQRGLDSCRGPKMRLQLQRIDNFIVLNDAYNANADSVNAALDTLRAFPCRGRRIAVLGDMAELGHTAESAHQEIGRRAAEAKVDYLIAAGKSSGITGAAARSAGLGNVFELRELDEVVQKLGQLVRAGDIVLVKASRSSGFERITEELKKQFGEQSSRLTGAGAN